VLGGEHGDVPLEPTSGELIANLITGKGISVVIDLSLMRKGEQKRFMIDFAETLYHDNRTPLHLILDEADEFAPQRPMGDDARMLGAIEDLVRRGRARGIGVTLITQRPAVLNKNVLTQIEVLIAMRLTSPQDRQALNEWVKYHADTDSAADMITSLPTMPIGTAWIWSPGWLDIFKKVSVRARETLDSSSTPKIGEKKIEATKLAPVDLEHLKEQMAATIKKAEAEDPKLLRRRIIELEKQVNNQEPQVEVREVEVPIITDEQLDAIIAACKQVQDVCDGVLGALQASPQRSFAKPTTNKITPVAPVLKEPEMQISDNNGDVNLRAGERRILQVLAQHYPMRFTRNQLGTLSRFSPRGGTFGTYFGTLKRNGLIEENGDVAITQAGLNYLGADIPAPQTTEQVIDMWRSALRAGERKMLDTLVNIYPKSITRADLGDRAGFSAAGGTFGTYLGSLRRNGLIEVEGSEVRASDSLFVGA
jgi:hypothetical protein